MRSKIVDLGRKISENLEETDTLGRWMAFHLAEMISTYDLESGSVDEDKFEKICELVFQFWRNRDVLPCGCRPLLKLDVLDDVLVRLSRERPPWRFSGVFSRELAPSQCSVRENEILSLALDLDRYSGNIIRHLVYLSALEVEKDEEWAVYVMDLVDDPLRRLRSMIEGLQTDRIDGNVRSELADVKSEIDKASESLHALKIVLEGYQP